MKKYLLMSSLVYGWAALLGTGGCSGERTVEPANRLPGENTAPFGVRESYGQPLVFYAQVDKAGNYLRRMFIDSLSARAVRATGKLPDNALLVMEAWFGQEQSSVFVPRRRNGEWFSGSFAPGSPDFTVALRASCNNCHARAAGTEMTFTRPLLQKALQRERVQVIECNESSFTPCDLSVYQGN